MQVTDAMVAAAMKAFRLQPADLNIPDPESMYIDHRRMRDAIQAALDADPEIDDCEPPPFVAVLTEERLADLPTDVAEAVSELLVSRAVWRNLGHRQGDELRQLRDERDARGHDLRVPVRIHVQVDEEAFAASVVAAVQALPAALPRDDQGRISIATLDDDLAPATGGLVTDAPEALGSFTAPLDGSHDPLRLVGVGSIAAHLGVSFTQVDTWIQQGSAVHFPEPFTWTTFGPRWQLGVIDQWYELWKASNGG